MAPSLIKLCHQVSGEFGNLSEQSKTKSSLHAQIMKNRLRRCDRVKPLGPPHRVHSSRQQDGAASHLHRAAHHQHIHAREREREREMERERAALRACGFPDRNFGSNRTWKKWEDLRLRCLQRSRGPHPRQSLGTGWLGCGHRRSSM